MKADPTEQATEAPAHGIAGGGKSKALPRRGSNRRQDLRDAQKKFKQTNLDQGRKRIQFYVPMSAIDVIKKYARAYDDPIGRHYEKAIVDFARNLQGPVEVKLKIHDHPLSNTVTTANPSAISQSPPKAGPPAANSRQSKPAMTAKRMKQRRQIMRSTNLKKLRTERKLTYRIVAHLTKKLPLGHQYNPPKNGRGEDIGGRAPKMYQGRDSKKNKAVKALAIKKVKEQIALWHKRESAIIKELQKIAKIV